MGSARKVGTNESIHTYGNGTREYTSLQTWEDAHTVDCFATTTSHVLECYDDAASFNDYVAITGATTNATYFRIIRPAGTKGNANWQGHDGTVANGFSIFSTTQGNVFNIGENYSQVQDIIVKLTCATSTNACVANNLGSGFVGVLCFDGSCTTGIVGGFNGNVNGIFIDCLAHNMTGGGMAQTQYLAGGVYTYNCTATNNGGVGFGMAGNKAAAIFVYKNCVSYGNTGADFASTATGGPTITMITNASEDDTADDWGGTDNHISTDGTLSFVGVDDFHLASDCSRCIDNGTDLSADGTYAFNDDIDWQTRSGTWDRGFDEYVATGIYAGSWHPEISKPFLEKREVIPY